MVYQKVPKVVSNFVLYRTTRRDVMNHEKSAGFIIIGQTGSGKSWLGLRIACDLDPSFASHVEERVVYTVEDFIRLVASGKLKRGNVVIFDELAHSEGADSRAAMSKSNRILGGVVSTYRQLGLIVIWILPTLTQLDKNIRMVSITGFFKILGIDYERKLTRVAYYSNSLNPVMGKSYYKTPVMKDENGCVVKVKGFLFSAPPLEVAKRYKKMKKKFVMHIAKKAEADIAPVESKVNLPKSMKIKDYVSLVLKDMNRFMFNGKLDTSIVESELDIGRDKANTIVKAVLRARDIL